MRFLSWLLFLAFLLISASACAPSSVEPTGQQTAEDIREMVYQHAEAWKTGDLTLLDELLHQDVVFAYPGRRLNKTQTLEDLDYFREHFTDTEVYVHELIIEDNKVAVEWQFATTDKETGHRQVVSDAIIAEVADGKFLIWKEYLDGRVKTLQKEGTLALEEGREPYPWPLRKS